MPITLTSFAEISGRPPAASLRLALCTLGSGFGPESCIVFYASQPGAMVDLAADLSYLLCLRRTVSAPHTNGGDHRSGDEDVSAVALDVDLPPSRSCRGSPAWLSTGPSTARLGSCSAEVIFPTMPRPPCVTPPRPLT